MGLLRLRILAPTLLVLLWSFPASAGKSVSLYLDGAVVDRDAVAKNGYLEFPLSTAVRPETLRIRPAGSARILRVKVAEREPDGKVAKELAAMTERQELLQDRLKALAVKEEIFKSAAKSQSAKAPRRTKTNPEPLATIRQGTDYAIAQLESVYQARRKVNRELKLLEEKRARVLRDDRAGGSVARVWLTPSSGAASATYVQSDRSWQPRYEIRANGTDKARLSVFPGEIALHRGESASYNLSDLKSGNGTPAWNQPENGRPVFEMELPAIMKRVTAGALPVTKLTLTNTGKATIPAGEFSCFCDGVYHGSGKLDPLAPGGIVELDCGGN